MDFKKIMELQKQAMAVNAKLENTHIEAESDGLVITFDARMNCVQAELENKSLLSNEGKLLEAIKVCVNKGIKKSQEVAASEMGGLMGALGIDVNQLSGADTPTK